jgi:hypothetical protein
VKGTIGPSSLATDHSVANLCPAWIVYKYCRVDNAVFGTSQCSIFANSEREREREREREKDLSSTETKFQELSLQFTETVKKATTLIN